MGTLLKAVLLTSYSLIILMGQIIGIPFFVWLIGTSFDFGNAEQVYAIFGIIGIVLIFTNHWKSRLIRIVSLLLMTSPIIKRLYETPIEKFNYLAFQIPLAIFLFTYVILIIKTEWGKNSVQQRV